MGFPIATTVSAASALASAVAILAADWTGEDHQAFAAFLRERL